MKIAFYDGLYWLLVSEPGFFGGFQRFPIKHVWRLVFEIRDRSPGGDLVETILSTFLATRIDPGTDPRMAGMLVGIWLG